MKRIDHDQAAARHARFRSVHPKVLEELVLAGRAAPDYRVLEVGCGTGNYIQALQSALGARCVGVDPSEAMLEYARLGNYKVTYKLGSAESLPADPDWFDLVFSVDLVHHLRDQLRSLCEAYRVLRPGGLVSVATDSEAIIKKRLLARYFPETTDMDLARYPGMARLRIEMKAAGFVRIVENTVKARFEVSDISPYKEKAFSVLELIPSHAHRAGLERMETDLARGPIKAESRYSMLWGMK